MNCRFLLVFLLGVSIFTSLGAETVKKDTLDFVNQVRSLRGSTYAQLYGTVQHRRLQVRRCNQDSVSRTSGSR